MHSGLSTWESASTSQLLKESMKGPADEAQQLGTQLANKLLDKGAREILAEVYGQKQE